MPTTPALNVLIVDDEANIRRTLAIALEIDGHRTVAVGNPDDALAEAARASFDLAFVDLRIGAASGLDLILRLRAQSPWTMLIVITAHGTIESAVEAMKRGAADYLTKPFTPAQVTAITRRLVERRALDRKSAIGQGGAGGQAESEMVLESASPAMQSAISVARQVAGSDASVLIGGESGTGKGVLARAIHQWSARAGGPFTVVSCPSLSAQLLEGELFGHARGAFTGAVRDNPGRIAATQGGTLFLDEIGDLPLELQPKLLRFLQEKEYERLGETTVRRADVRVIAATNVDLDAAVKAGRFREDLLYRVNVVRIDVPALRDRPGDLLPLARRMLADLGAERGIVEFTDDAMDAMAAYHWPGNVRELRNAIERAVILCQSDRIGADLLPEAAPAGSAEARLGDPLSIDRIKELHVRRVLATARTLEEAAGILGIDVATLWRMRKKLGI